MKADVSAQAAKSHAKTVVRATRSGAAINVSSVHHLHRKRACLMLHLQELAVRSCLSAAAVAAAAAKKVTASRPLTGQPTKWLMSFAAPTVVVLSVAMSVAGVPTASPGVSG
jgi:hypothetical protein